MRLSELKRFYAQQGTYTGTAEYLSSLYGESVFGNEVRRALMSGTMPPKLRKMGSPKRHRYCFEFPSAIERDLFAEIVSKKGGQKAILAMLLPDD